MVSYKEIVVNNVSKLYSNSSFLTGIDKKNKERNIGKKANLSEVCVSSSTRAHTMCVYYKILKYKKIVSQRTAGNKISKFTLFLLQALTQLLGKITLPYPYLFIQ